MSNPEKIRIFSVDDNPLLHEGLAMVIRHQPDMQLVAEAEDGQGAIERFREYKPDVTLMDLRLPDMSGIDAMIAIRSEFAGARIIILTTFAVEAEIQCALENGARAYVLKTRPPQELVEVIRQVHAGKTPIPEDLSGRSAEHHDAAALPQRDILKPLPVEESTTFSGTSPLQPSENRLHRWLLRFRGK
jgi:DNA-binding NarL/FixJ family response regulator